MISNVSNHSLESAWVIWTRMIGYSIGETEYTETLRYSTHASLKHTPIIKLVSVKGRADHTQSYNGLGTFSILGKTGWIDIPIPQVMLHTKDDRAAVTLPDTLFGTQYSEVEVTYTAGLADVPQDVENAVLEIATLLENGEITEWNVFLPDHVHDVIDKYRKEVG